MPITSTIIGTLGGTEIKKIDVPDYRTNQANTLLVTVPVPSGKQARISVGFAAEGASSAAANNSPQVQVGDKKITIVSNAKTYSGGNFLVTGPTDVSHIRQNTISNYTTNISEFEIYWWLVE